MKKIMERLYDFKDVISLTLKSSQFIEDERKKQIEEKAVNFDTEKWKKHQYDTSILQDDLGLKEQELKEIKKHKKFLEMMENFHNPFK